MPIRSIDRLQLLRRLANYYGQRAIIKLSYFLLYSCLISYLILLLVDIPEIWGNKLLDLLDKLCYLEGCMRQEFSYAHWIDHILENCPFRLIMGAVI